MQTYKTKRHLKISRPYTYTHTMTVTTSTHNQSLKINNENYSFVFSSHADLRNAVTLAAYSFCWPHRVCSRVCCCAAGMPVQRHTDTHAHTHKVKLTQQHLLMSSVVINLKNDEEEHIHSYMYVNRYITHTHVPSFLQVFGVKKKFPLLILLTRWFLTETWTDEWSCSAS